MPVRLLNDLTRQEEELVPQEPGRVTFYNCGPTVYNLFHIGNARTFLVFDALRRYLRYRGYTVTYVQNFTDVDDKIIRRAAELGVPERELADQMIQEYFRDADALGIERADFHPRVTDHIPEIVEHIAALVEKGYAYEIPGDGVYYRVTRKPDYGKLSHRSLDELQAGARVEVDPRKEHPMDFALWKAQKEGEIAWDSPWGKGRPGWHIECSVMARHYLGDTLDIHSGGEDLIFPHHENEIAQSEPVTGKPFARIWLHTAFLNIGGEKMSKSRGNFFWVRDVLRQYDGEAVRFFLLSAHYRNPLDWRDDLVEAARAGLERLYNAARALRHLAQAASREELTDAERTLLADLRRHRDRFVEALDADFNTAVAQAVLFDLARDTNTRVQPGASRALARGALDLLLELGGVLGLFGRFRQEAAEDGGLDAEIERLIALRQEARKARNFAEADRIRDELRARGILLEDTPAGVRWRRA
ncbi:cysteine--tRNA ligase [Caldinitratiruptor microaerophilus]|uniref:Cysteine--tRNA ligase n=1 Tax=Caldinitratiruptor microaerophilus TaxID=671077 RepID=A0AA35CMN4_9FIRM|nr:cysteine--tRNA ligase [Caldinitratiruptor microaerophilus]BDG62130.1 cysteine--tRNA ligase [Caldinitratiruptor microaerophilus]